MEDRREHIVDATIGCLQRKGLAGTSLTDICQAAGISRGALYIHFDSKDQILDAVIRRQAAQSLVRLQFDTAPALRFALREQIRVVTGNLSVMFDIELEMLLAGRTNKRLGNVIAGAVAERFDHLKSGLEFLHRKGVLRPEVSALAAAHMVNSFLIGLFVTAGIQDFAPGTHDAALDLLLSAILTP